jgi:hypothetical protein
MDPNRGSPGPTSPGTAAGVGASAHGDDPRQQVRGRAEEQKTRAGDTVEDVAGAARAAADDLERRGETQLADLARSAASQFATFADTLHHRNVDDILRDARRLAQSNPAVFIGGSVAVGFALARLFKSGGGSAAGVSGTAGGGIGSGSGIGSGYGETTSRTYPGTAGGHTGTGAMDAPMPTASRDPLATPSTGTRPGGAAPGAPDRR